MSVIHAETSDLVFNTVTVEKGSKVSLKWKEDKADGAKDLQSKLMHFVVRRSDHWDNCRHGAWEVNLRCGDQQI